MIDAGLLLPGTIAFRNAVSVGYQVLRGLDDHSLSMRPLPVGEGDVGSLL